MQTRIITESRELAGYISNNYSTILGVAEKIWDEVMARHHRYSDDEIKIINAVQKFYHDIFRTTDYPVHFKYSSKYTTHKMPAYEIDNIEISLDENKIFHDALTPEFRAIIVRFIDYYNACRAEFFSGNFKANKYIILYLIDMMYAFSNAKLDSPSMLKEIEDHIDFVQRIMTIKELDCHKYLMNDNTNTGKTLAQIEKDVERDFFMDAAEAEKDGIIDEIITKSKAPVANSK